MFLKLLNCQLIQNCLQAEEVRELVRKRKQYEYKLQKRSKVKEDFLEYITYESNLLKLLEMRRESTGYQHKQAEIEGRTESFQFCIEGRDKQGMWFSVGKKGIGKMQHDFISAIPNG